jgi:hypothetical protein
MGGWALYAVIAAASLAGCITVPQIGWVGWVLLIGLYLVARRNEQLEQKVRDLEEPSDGDD